MSMRTVMDPRGSDTLLVEKTLGSAYETVKIVADRIAEIVAIGSSMDEMVSVHADLPAIRVIGQNTVALNALFTKIDSVIGLAAEINKVTTVHGYLDNILVINTNLTQILSLAANIGSLQQDANDIRAMNTRLQQLEIVRDEILVAFEQITDSVQAGQLAMQRAQEAQAISEAKAQEATNAADRAEERRDEALTAADSAASSALAAQTFDPALYVTLAQFETDIPVGLATKMRHGECRLEFNHQDEILLKPHNGDRIIINNVERVIRKHNFAPLSSTALTPSKLHFVYAWFDEAANDGAGVLKLEAQVVNAVYDPVEGQTVLTGLYQMDLNSGIVVAKNNPSRTLVGMVYATEGGKFADDPARRFVASYFNRRRRALYRTEAEADGVQGSSSFTVYTEVPETVVRGLCWQGAMARLRASGCVWSGLAGAQALVKARVNGVEIGAPSGGHSHMGAYTVGASVVLDVEAPKIVEGVNTFSLGLKTSSTGSIAAMTMNLNIEVDI